MSRLKSARVAKTRATPTQRGIYVQKPKSDVYVAMLGIALGAIVIGCILLLLVWGRYEYKTTVSALGNPVPTSYTAPLASQVTTTDSIWT